MSFAPQQGDVQVSMPVMGGLVTNQPASTLPEGVTPDNQDGAFLPGGWFSRAALKRVFAPGTFPAGGPLNYSPTITYAKSFVTQLGGIENLYLDSNGTIYWEDVINAPGTLTNIGTVTIGSWGKSITAFGREYVAVSDSLHGSDIPLQWDGTNLDRVTQDGPGAPPNIASIALPAVNMQATGSLTLTLTESDPAGLVGGNFTGINTWTANSVAAVNVGDAITIAGYGGSSAPMNGMWTIVAIFTGGGGGYANLLQLSALLPSTTVFSLAAATGSVSTGTMVRQGNIVTVNTAAAHQLQVGYQAQIAGVPAGTVDSGISSIAISNEQNPGVATVTMNAAHGLLPGLFVSITGVSATAVGGGIASAARAGQVVTITTNSAHGLSPGAVVTISGVTPASFNSTVQVVNVVSTTVFTFLQVDVDATATGFGAVSINWPIPDTPTPTYYEVLAAPTATTFQVSITYSDGTWASGAVTYAWGGTFTVTAVPSPTSFQYQQYGPNATTNAVGTVTPFGQAAPGVHQCQVLFLTRQGAITEPSPAVQFTASGGQYLSITNIPIGPSNIVARILAFTGASGSLFFYIPSTPQVNGQVVGTATQINDNLSTSAFLDFSDATLFAALSISIPGNNLANQVVIDSALGFGLYADRLAVWGMRNRIQNFLNLSFDGGQFYNAAGGTASNFPCGWLVGSGTSGGGALVTTGRWGWAWQPSGAGSIYQSAFEDSYGVPILTPNTTYRLRLWIKGTGTSATLTISSVSASFSTSATVSAVSTGGQFVEANFGTVMPSPIPSDMILTLTWSGTPIIDEINIIYQANPYLDKIAYFSYDQNPEAFDGVSGKLGSTQDGHKWMEMADIRTTGYFLTQDPGGRLHEFTDNGVTEPAGWTVRQVAANCGLLSAWGLSKSQADDSSASGGEEWFAWASSVGPRIFGGSEPSEIGREIWPDWVGAATAQATQWSSAPGINPSFAQYIWCLNDPVTRVIYFGLTLAAAPQGAGNRVYALNYVGLNSAGEIASTGPVRIGFSGKRIATDHSRKWTRWNSSVTLNGAALMYRVAGQTQPIFFAGNGVAPGTLAGFGNVYLFNPAQYSDDDYGQMFPYYVVGPIPGEETEAASGLAGFRKLIAYVSTYVYSPVACSLTAAAYVDNLSNAWSLGITRPLASNPKRDLEFAGCSAKGNRVFYKLAAIPTTGINCALHIERFTAWVRKDRHLPVAGA